MFSELVDKAVGRSRRSSRFLDIVDWARATIRDAGKSAFFFNDMIEDQLTPTADPFIWTIPAPQLFRKLRTVKYEIGDGVYPDLKMPGKAQLGRDRFYYRGGDDFVFKGVGSGLSTTDFALVDIAYYQFLAPLAYYSPGPYAAAQPDFPGNITAAATNTRPAVYDRPSGTWVYLQAGSYVTTLGSAILEQAARDAVSNWLLRDWYDLAIEGTLAKLYKSVNDPRATLAFSLYQTYLTDLKATGVDESLDY